MTVFLKVLLWSYALLTITAILTTRVEASTTFNDRGYDYGTSQDYKDWLADTWPGAKHEYRENP